MLPPRILGLNVHGSIVSTQEDSGPWTGAPSVPPRGLVEHRAWAQSQVADHLLGLEWPQKWLFWQKPEDADTSVLLGAIHWEPLLSRIVSKVLETLSGSEYARKMIKEWWIDKKIYYYYFIYLCGTGNWTPGPLHWTTTLAFLLLFLFLKFETGSCDPLDSVFQNAGIIGMQMHGITTYPALIYYFWNLEIIHILLLMLFLTFSPLLVFFRCWLHSRKESSTRSRLHAFINTQNTTWHLTLLETFYFLK